MKKDHFFEKALTRSMHDFERVTSQASLHWWNKKAGVQLQLSSEHFICGYEASTEA